MSLANITHRTLQHRQGTAGPAYDVFTLSEAWADGTSRSVKLRIGSMNTVTLINSETRRRHRRVFESPYDAWAAWTRMTGLRADKLFTIAEHSTCIRLNNDNNEIRYIDRLAS